MENYPELEDCKLITFEEYCELKKPKFIAQTTIDEDRMYYMVWKSEGIMYKTHSKL